MAKNERSMRIKAEAELADEHECRMRLRDEVKQLTEVNERLNRLRMAMYTGLIIERNDLLTRVMRIDARIAGLDLPVPPPPLQQI